MLTHASQLANPRQQDVHLAEHARLLIVRHGWDRGPAIRLRRFRPARLQPMFDDISRRHEELGGRFSYWRTGEPLPDLADVAAVVFILQDPLRELYPQCYEDASRLAEKAKQAGAKLVNPPDALSNSIKSIQAKMWTDAGIPTPRAIRFSNRQELTDAVHQIGGPVLIKSDNLHTQACMFVCRNLDELAKVPDSRLPGCGAVSPLVDTREGWSDVDPASPFATHYHKKRVMVFGDHVCNNHIFFGDHPIVGCGRSTFGHYRSWNPIYRMARNAKYKSHFDEDFGYWDSAPEEPELMSAAARALGLEICAIDYSKCADGKTVLWEANPFFSLHQWPIDVLGRKRRLPIRMPRVHDCAAMFFRDLLAEDS